MFVKAGIAASALICAAVLLSSLDFREIYNEMYPVNGLRRDVLGLCREAKPAFIRAVRGDRDNCYDSMPHSVELAIGWVRTSNRLVMMQKTPTAIELAERLMAEAAAPRRFGIGGPRQFAGYLTMPGGAMPGGAARRCTDAAAGLPPIAASTDLRSDLALGLPARLPSERLARRIADDDDVPLAALIRGGPDLLPRAMRPEPLRDRLPPILRLGDAGPASVVATGNAGAAAALFAPTPATDPRDGLGWLGAGVTWPGASLEGLLAPRESALGCRISA